MAVRKIIFLLLILSAGLVSDAQTTARPTTKAPTTAKPTTKAPTTAKTTAEVIRPFGVVFRSQENFTNDLGSPSSADFMRRASLIKTELEPVFKREFTSYRTFDVLAFRAGSNSLFNIMEVGFVSASAPNETQVIALLNRTAPTVTAFDIDTTFITVNGFGNGIGASSGGVSHKISFITAFCLVLLSWFLSKQH